MKTKYQHVLIVLERTKTGYSAYTKDIPGIFSTGKTLDEIQTNMQEAIESHKEVLEELDEIVPKKLQGKYELIFQLDVSDFFEMVPDINISKFAERAGINSSLMRQYAKGIKHPGVNQAKAIEASFHKMSKDLSRIHLTE